MKAQLRDGRTLRIVFKHYRHTGTIPPEGTAIYNYVEDGITRVEERLGVRPGQLDAATECWLDIEGSDLERGEAHGVSGCSRHDEWDAEEGRRVALGRAIATVIPREDLRDRQAVWNAYFSRGFEEAAEQMLRDIQQAALQAGYIVEVDNE